MDGVLAYSGDWGWEVGCWLGSVGQQDALWVGRVAGVSFCLADAGGDATVPARASPCFLYGGKERETATRLENALEHGGCSHILF